MLRRKSKRINQLPADIASWSIVPSLAPVYVTGNAQAARLGIERLAAEVRVFAPELAAEILQAQPAILAGMAMERRAWEAAAANGARWRDALAKGQTDAGGALRSSVDLHGITSTQETFSGARRAAIARFAGPLQDLDFVRVWDATLDRRTCERCMNADGKWVLPSERFPWGEPPLHPHCRCSDSLVPRSWVNALDIAA